MRHHRRGRRDGGSLCLAILVDALRWRSQAPFRRVVGTIWRFPTVSSVDSDSYPLSRCRRGRAGTRSRSCLAPRRDEGERCEI